MVGRGGRVRQRRPLAAGEHGGHPMPLRGQNGMADGVDAAVQAMEAPGAHPLADPGVADAKVPQLLPGDDAVLGLGELGNPGVERGLVAIWVHLNP